jgi:translation elongation factor EF-4
MKHFYWISTKEMTCGVSTEDNKIIDAPPILKKFIGGDIDRLRKWMNKQEGYKEIEIKERKKDENNLEIPNQS